MQPKSRQNGAVFISDRADRYASFRLGWAGFDLATWCPCERPLGSHLQAEHHPPRLLHLLLQLLLVGLQLLLPGSPLLLRRVLPQARTQPTENHLSCSRQRPGFKHRAEESHAQTGDHLHNSCYLGAAC